MSKVLFTTIYDHRHYSFEIAVMSCLALSYWWSYFKFAFWLISSSVTTPNSTFLWHLLQQVQRETHTCRILLWLVSQEICPPNQNLLPWAIFPRKYAPLLLKFAPPWKHNLLHHFKLGNRRSPGGGGQISCDTGSTYLTENSGSNFTQNKGEFWHIKW